MRRRWTGLDGWPCDFSRTPWGEEVKTAIRNLDGGEKISADLLGYLAQLIGDAIDAGEAEAHPWLQDAGRKRSEKQLNELLALSEKFRAKVRGLNLPAVNALNDEMYHPSKLLEHLESFEQAARDARAMLEEREAAKGARAKYVAHKVTRAASGVYEQVTGKSGGYTTNPDGGERTGPFIDFVQKVFDIWQIDAKASAQVKAIISTNNSD